MRTSSFSATSKALFLFLFVVAALLAQPAATVQWDVRTTGSDNNGGGFDPASAGTDQSQGAAAVTIDNSTVKATVAASTITFTAGYTPSSADVGNIVNIISSTGGTPPTFKRYQISSETLTTWVLNQTTGAAGATITSAIMGGSLLTVAKGFSVEVNKNTVWLKAGTYTLTTGLTAPSLTYSGLVGYQTTHGDNGTAPLITTATNSLTMLTQAGASLLLSDVSMSNTAVTRGVGISPGASLTIQNCVLNGFSNGISVSSAAAVTAVNVKITASTGAAWLQAAAGAPTFCFGCVIINNTGAGYSDAGGSAMNLVMVNSIISGNGGGGILSSANTDFMVVASSDFSGNTGAGIAASGSSPQVYVYNSIFYSNSTYGISITTALLPTHVFGLTNAYGANGTNPRNNFPVESGAITLTANPFTSSTNFALNATSGGGTLLRGTGLLGPFIGGATTGYADVGAVQSQGAGQVGYPIIQ